jgi:hypothetical protein
MLPTVHQVSPRLLFGNLALGLCPVNCIPPYSMAKTAPLFDLGRLVGPLTLWLLPLPRGVILSTGSELLPAAVSWLVGASGRKPTPSQRGHADERVYLFPSGRSRLVGLDRKWV